MHTMLRRKVRPRDWRPHCRLHDLLQHGGVLLCGKELARGTGDWGEYNIGLYSVRGRHVLATHPNRQHGLHKLPDKQCPALAYLWVVPLQGGLLLRPDHGHCFAE